MNLEPSQDRQAQKALEGLRQNHPPFYFVFLVLIAGLIVYVVWSGCR